jgi:hypothetical protein
MPRLNRARRSATAFCSYHETIRDKGSPLTSVSNAYDQKWVNGRNVFESISQVVDDIFDNYISSPNVLQYLVDTFQLRLISNPEDDIKTCLGQAV